MRLSPAGRKVALVAHICSSVGWFGAVLAFLALAIAGVLSQDEQVARAAYLMMAPVGWFVIVPLNLASLATGLVSSLATSWGLLRHYWVLAKLAINVLATVVLLLYMQTLGALADLARRGPVVNAHGLRDASPILHTGAAIVLLLLAMILAVYKPRGLTAYGRRAPRARQASHTGGAATSPT
jgi:hypothetical protein